MSDALCAVCWRREPARGLVCEPDRKRLAAQLAALPRQILALDEHLVPTAVGFADERVHLTRVEAPLPLRTDVLSLLGPGSEDVDWMPALSVLHPAVRRWSTTQTVVIERLDGRQLVREERTITDWHQELVLDAGGRSVLVRDDDQTGVIPPREWLDIWTRRFRRHFGHHVPARTTKHRPPAEPSLEADERQRRARTVLGFNEGRGGTIPALERPDDPLADEWVIRFGGPPRYQAAAADVRYLTTWLDAACDDHPDIGAMAAELRSLSAELRRILGEAPEQQWLGRCPAVIVESDDVRRPCGAGLWQDPYVSQAQCPRCSSTWGTSAPELLALARDIRTMWPLDRRRRYSAADRRQVPAVACAGCGQELAVQWREITAAADRERWWRFSGVACASGCADAGKGV